jgi:ABC-2 type transport system ATP-binding protein
MHDPAPLIEAEGLTRDYGPLRAVDDVSLRVGRGEVLGLLGPNGAGKTSTLRMVCGTLAPTGGRVAIAGADLLEAPRAARAALGYLPERPPLYPAMTVRSDLRFAAAIRGVPRGRRGATVSRAIERCGLGDSSDRLIAHLSLGYRQRVGIAQAVVHEPPAIILDEPTLGLDPIQIRAVRSLIAELGREHALILSTHILPEVQAVCTHVAILHHGRIAYAAPTDSVGKEGADTLLLGLARPPALETLRRLAGVQAAENRGPGRFRLRLDPAATSPRAIGEHAVEAGWGLEELTPERGSLEQVFVAVTAREPEAAATATEHAA